MADYANRLQNNGSSDLNSILQAIASVAPNPQVAMAMLVGAWYETRWNPNLNVMDNNGYNSTGPFMINQAPGNSYWDAVGQSVQNAQDPAIAAKAMLQGYIDAVGRVSPSQWQSDPQSAAELAAYYAERPAVPYTQSQGPMPGDVFTQVHQMATSPGTASGANASLLSDTTTGQGQGGAQTTAGTTTTTGVPNTTPTVPGMNDIPALVKYIKQNWPTYSWLLDVPSVTTTLEKAVANGFSDQQIQAAVSQTQWWKTTANSVQQFQQLKNTSPAELTFKPGTQASQMYAQVQAAANQAGLKLDAGQLQHMALNAIEFGWNNDQLTRNVGSLAASGQGTTVSPTYLQQMTQNPKQLQFSSGGGSKTVADQQLSQVQAAAPPCGINLPTGKAQETGRPGHGVRLVRHLPAAEHRQLGRRHPEGDEPAVPSAAGAEPRRAAVHHGGQHPGRPGSADGADGIGAGGAEAQPRDDARPGHPVLAVRMEQRRTGHPYWPGRLQWPDAVGRLPGGRAGQSRPVQVHHGGQHPGRPSPQHHPASGGRGGPQAGQQQAPGHGHAVARVRLDHGPDRHRYRPTGPRGPVLRPEVPDRPHRQPQGVPVHHGQGWGQNDSRHRPGRRAGGGGPGGAGAVARPPASHRSPVHGVRLGPGPGGPVHRPVLR